MGLFSPEWKEFIVDGVKFSQKPDPNCIRGILERDNFLKRGVVEEGKRIDDCFKSQIEAKQKKVEALSQTQE